MKALVIGGSSAIGEGIIKQLVTMGYQVTFTYHRNADKAQTLCAVFGDNCQAVQLDLSNFEQVVAFVGELNADSAPDVLVNVAGITHDALCVGNTGETLRKVHTVNFLSPASICGQVAELMMAKRGGSIVNVTSVAARFPRVGNAAYGSAKSALERFTATLALEVARFKVRTLCIAPAFVDTPMFHQFAAGNEKEVIRSLPLREILAVDDVANAVGSFVSGQIKTTGVTLSLTNGQPVF